MSADTIEKLAILMMELMQELKQHSLEIAQLRKEVLQLKDICRGCAGFQQDDFK